MWVTVFLQSVVNGMKNGKKIPGIWWITKNLDSNSENYSGLSRIIFPTTKGMKARQSLNFKLSHIFVSNNMLWFFLWWVIASVNINLLIFFSGRRFLFCFVCVFSPSKEGYLKLIVEYATYITRGYFLNIHIPYSNRIH